MRDLFIEKSMAQTIIINKDANHSNVFGVMMDNDDATLKVEELISQNLIELVFESEFTIMYKKIN